MIQLCFKTRVIATIKDKYGRVIYRQEGQNNITNGDPAAPTSDNNMLVFALERLCPNATSYFDNTDTINKMQLGTGTPSNSGLGTPWASPKTIQSADCNLIEAPSDWYEAPFVRNSVTWDFGDGAFSGITEAGLFNSATVLMAYKTFSPALSKIAEAELTIQWDFGLSYTAP